MVVGCVWDGGGVCGGRISDDDYTGTWRMLDGGGVGGRWVSDHGYVGV